LAIPVAQHNLSFPDVESQEEAEFLRQHRALSTMRIVASTARRSAPSATRS
jgi:hypothetical protein